MARNTSLPCPPKPNVTGVRPFQRPRTASSRPPLVRNVTGNADFPLTRQGQCGRDRAGPTGQGFPFDAPLVRADQPDSVRDGATKFTFAPAGPSV